MPKVSVIIPVYGVEKYIERCARSLFEQTLDNIEFIFVNDCTPDRSIEILKTIIEEYQSRMEEKKYSIRIDRMKKNSGLPAVRKYGVNNAIGNYIIFCDSDDWVDRTLYQRMYEQAICEDADIVVCDYVETDGIVFKNKKIGLLSCEKEKCIKDMMYLRTSWGVWNKMIKRKYFNQITEFPKDYMGEDMALTLSLMAKIDKISYCPNSYYNYFINPASPSRQDSEECAIRKFLEVECNYEIVKSIYCRANDTTYIKALNYICLFHKMQLLHYRKNIEIRSLMNKDFYDVMRIALFDKNLDCKIKVKICAMILMKIFKII